MCLPVVPKRKGIITSSCSIFPSFVVSWIITPSGEWLPCLSSIDRFVIIPPSLRTNKHKHAHHISRCFLSPALANKHREKNTTTRLGGSGLLATRWSPPHCLFLDRVIYRHIVGNEDWNISLACWETIPSDVVMLREHLGYFKIYKFPLLLVSPRRQTGQHAVSSFMSQRKWVILKVVDSSKIQELWGQLLM